MEALKPINSWQLRRLGIFADMIKAVIDAYQDAYPESYPEQFKSEITQLDEFREFSKEARVGHLPVDTDDVSKWLNRLEGIESDCLERIFKSHQPEIMDIIYDACHKEGETWGKIAVQNKGMASTDARKALLILNDYLVHGYPTDNTIEVVHCEKGQITYNLNRCLHSEEYEKRPQIAWLLCSSRQAWKDGFFNVLGGIAHQLVSGKCQGEDRCMHVITVTDEEN